MTQFIYTHHQGSEGKMVEKATMEKPDRNEYNFGFGHNEKESFLAKEHEYNLHIASLITYAALGFSPSDNGKTFGDDQFEVKLQKKLTIISEWRDCADNEPQSPSYDYRQIAVPLSEKREERTQDELWEGAEVRDVKKWPPEKDGVYWCIIEPVPIAYGKMMAKLEYSKEEGGFLQEDDDYRPLYWIYKQNS